MTRRFVPTHEITLTDLRDHTRSTFPVRLVDGQAYTKAEWESGAMPSWEYHDENWWHGDDGSPAPHLSVSVRKLSPGPTGRTGSPGKPVTIRASDAERKRWESAAKREKRSLGDWLRGAAEMALAKGSTR